MSNKDDIVQAVIVADTFADEFVPLTNDIPFSLMPLVNRPIIEYTLEFLSLGGIDEVFLFCCFHADVIKAYIKKRIDDGVEWSLKMRVNVIVSESCHSFGDCLRDLDCKALLRGNFVLVEPGTVSNIKLLPILKKHIETANKDKGAAITLILQERGNASHPAEELMLATNNSNNRLLYYQKFARHHNERKLTFALDIFMDTPCVTLYNDLQDTHIAICSPSVLPLYSDNFDFQTKDDFVRGLLMNEEILGSTVYCHVAKGASFGAAVTSWRMYQTLSDSLQNKWVHPLQPPRDNKFLKDHVVLAKDAKVDDKGKVSKSVIGANVAIGKNVTILRSFILPGTKIENDVTITHSVIGPNCTIKTKCRVTAGSILGKGVVLESGGFVENALVQAEEPEDCDVKDKLGRKAYRLRIEEDDDDEDVLDGVLARKLSRMHIDDKWNETEDEHDGFSDSDNEELSYTQSPVPDDTKLFFTEVIDSLTRGFEDELHCNNLILEINSSRYAYNVTVKEVNFHVLKAILLMSLKFPTGPQYFSQFVRLLSYFAPVLKNYIRNDEAMLDTLQAIEDVAISNENINEKWIMFVLKWFYDKDYISEDVILNWAGTLDKKTRLHSQVKPFTDWLEEAEEATSSDESE